MIWIRVIAVVGGFWPAFGNANDPSTEERSWELAADELFMHSGEHIHHFLSSKGLVLYPGQAKFVAASHLRGDSRYLIGFAFPTKPEQLLNKQEQPIDATLFSKWLEVGYQHSIVRSHFKSAALLQYLGGGINTPVSDRFGREVAPVIKWVSQVVINGDSGLELKLGFTGLTAPNIWLLGVGVFYRM